MRRRAGKARPFPAGSALLAGALLAALLPAAALAQTARLQVVRGPYYAGVPIDLQIVTDDFDEEPQPEIRAEAPAGTTLSFVQARPQVSSMMQIVGGRITQSRTVRFVFVHQLLAPEPGRYELGPFTLEQDGRTATTERIVLDVIAVPRAAGQRLHVRLPDHPIYVGQRVPVTVEWWTRSGLADKLYDERLRVPLFLDAGRFQFLDAEREPTRLVVNVEVPGGVEEFPVDVRQEKDGGAQWVVRSFTRTMVPVATGRFELGEPTLVCEEAVAFQRDIFGSRVPSRTRRVRVSGRPLVVDVAAVPSAGRPASFAGAIGQGFSIDVVADRTVLQAGDPVRLTVTIRGDGSLDAAALPPLAAAGLSPAEFRLPDGETPGVVDDGAKRFDVGVRVLAPSVREIPPLEYSWFDPEAGRFETATSQPIALSVREASVVGAADVVRSDPDPSAPAAPAPPPEAGEDGEARGPATAAPAGSPAFTLTGADLSIETDPARLLSPGASGVGSTVVVAAGYTAGLLAMAAGLLVRRRRNRDPNVVARQRELRALRARVAAARRPREAADALRRISAALGGAPRPAAFDAVLAALDEAAFAPGAEQAPVADDLLRRATAAADAALEDAR